MADIALNDFKGRLVEAIADGADIIVVPMQADDADGTFQDGYADFFLDTVLGATDNTEQTGSTWARKVHLEQVDDKGWDGYLLIYGLESRDALEAYLKSDARERFWHELEPLNAVHRAERFYGSVDFAIERETEAPPIQL